MSRRRRGGRVAARPRAGSRRRGPSPKRRASRARRSRFAMMRALEKASHARPKGIARTPAQTSKRGRRDPRRRDLSRGAISEAPRPFEGSYIRGAATFRGGLIAGRRGGAAARFAARFDAEVGGAGDGAACVLFWRDRTLSLEFPECARALYVDAALAQPVATLNPAASLQNAAPWAVRAMRDVWPGADGGTALVCGPGGETAQRLQVFFGEQADGVGPRSSRGGSGARRGYSEGDRKIDDREEELAGWGGSTVFAGRGRGRDADIPRATENTQATATPSSTASAKACAGATR